MKSDKNISHRPILIIGNSHTTAIAAALNDQTRSIIDVVNLASFFDPINRRNKILHPEIADLFNPRYIFCSFGGSEHSVFGLLEAPTKFDFMTESCSQTEPDRDIITYGLVRTTLSRAMRGAMNNTQKLCALFNCSITHICTPPPFRNISEDAILPRRFQESLDLGVSPASIRKKLYETHSNIARELCASLNIGFLDIPLGTTDGDGFLYSKFCSKDPTHANSLYGELVIKQILEIANV